MSLASFLPRVKTRCVYSYYCCIFVSQMISHFGSSPYLSSSVYVFLRNFSLIMALDSFEPPDMFSFAPMLSVNARPPDGFVPPCIRVLGRRILRPRVAQETPRVANNDEKIAQRGPREVPKERQIRKKTKTTTPWF